MDRPTCKHLKGKHHLGDLSADESAIRNGSQNNWVGGYGLDSTGLGRVVVVGCLECQRNVGFRNSREFPDELGNSQHLNDSIQHHYVSWRDLRFLTSNILVATDASEKPDVSIFTFFSSALKMGLVDSSEASIPVLSHNTASHAKKYICILAAIYHVSLIACCSSSTSVIFVTAALVILLLEG